MMPWAHALYACDLGWWENNAGAWSNFDGYKFTWNAEAAKRYGIRHTPGVKAHGLGRECLHAGGSGGHMAVNLAYFMGAKQIALIGFDMQYTDGKSHWHGNHRKTGNPSTGHLAQWAKTFTVLYEDLKSSGIEMVNCTRETAIATPRRPLEAVLREAV